MPKNKKLDFELDFLDKNSQEFEKDKTRLAELAESNRKEEEKAARKNKAKNSYPGLLVGVLVVVGLIIWGISDTSNSSSSNASNSTPQQSGVQVGQYWCSDSDGSTADSMQPSASASSSLDAESSRVNALKAQIDSSTVNDYSPQYLINEYNSEVNTYNNELSQYNSDLSAYNTKVDAYNSYLAANCSKN